MKKIIFVLGFLMAISICVKGHNHYNEHVTISIQTFYDELAPYGEWIYTPEYGYAWRPYLEYTEGFRPYATRGNWVYTDLGWTWISEYRWGWATFHYGRWYFDDYFGWMWIPGYEWAPAWVTWGSYGDYWAWAPMGPNMHANFNYTWHAPRFWWTFVPFRHFCSSNWHSYIYNYPVQIANITYINNVYYENNYSHNNGNWYHGPRVRDVERHLNIRVQKRTLVDADKPKNLTSRDKCINVYRPGVTKKRENPQPGNFRGVEKRKTNTRVEYKNQQTTVVKKKRYGESKITPRASNQTTRVKSNNKPTIRQKERSKPHKRTTRVNNGTRSGSIKSHRVEPTRKQTGNHTNKRYTTRPPKTNVKRQKREPAPTRTVPSKTHIPSKTRRK